MICPKCGRPVDEAAVICRGCDFILDTEFLGNDILDEEHTLRPGAGGVDPGAFNLADAVILGNIDDESQSFETSDSGFHMQAHLQARLYVSGRSQALMSPDAVPALSSNSIEGVRLTPFERHVLAFIDGKKPVEVIRRAAGLDEAEVKTALATLADKGVVKVVGRALADFDPGTETAPRRAPQRHRVRGSMVGAVALVGDEADKAIEEAFRTQIALNPLLGPNGAKPQVADGDVFVAASGGRTTGSNTPAVRDSDLPSDFDQFVGLKGTDEIEKKKLTDASSSTVRPSAQKAAFNRAGTSAKLDPRLAGVAPGTQARPSPVADDADSQDGIDASAEASALQQRFVPPGKADASDGFDEFGVPSDIATAVVAQPPSDSSAPSAGASASASAAIAAARNAAIPERPASGVFADISNDLSDGDLSDGLGVIPALGNLADSRVQARPKLEPAVVQQSVQQSVQQPKPKPKTPANAQPKLEVPAAESEDSPSVEIERQAASGEVWDESPKPGAAATRRPSGGSKKTMSTSLSDLLSDKEEEQTKNIPPERVEQIVASGSPKRRPPPMPESDAPASDAEVPASASESASEGGGPEGVGDGIERDGFDDAPDESYEEPTAAGQPPPPMALPRMKPPTQQAAPVARPSTMGRGSAMASMPDEAHEAQAPSSSLDEHSGLHDVDAKKPKPPTRQAPGVVSRGAVDDIFDDDDSAYARPTAPEAQVRSSSSRREPQLVESIEVRSVHDDSIEATAPPSQLPASSSLADAPSEPASEVPLSQASSEELPAASDDDDARASEDDDDAEDASDPDNQSEDGSVEMVDSGLVIRPAAKGVGLAKAVANARNSSRPRPQPAGPAGRRAGMASMEQSDSAPQPPPPTAQARPKNVKTPKPPPEPSFEEELSNDDEASELVEAPNEDSEDTQNLDAEELERRGLGPNARRDQRDAAVVVGGRAGGGVAAIPSGFSQVVAQAEVGGPTRGRVTDENRRKARNLFDEAKKDAESGRLAQARMNAKLATIYDPDNASYRAQLEAWERPATQAKPPPQTAPTSQSQSQSVSRASDENQAEIKALYDEAQSYEDAGDIDQALDILEDGVQRFPNAAAFHNRIGVILALRKKDYEGAVQAIQRAIDIDPENLHYKSNLGKIVAKMRGRGAEA